MIFRKLKPQDGDETAEKVNRAIDRANDGRKSAAERIAGFEKEIFGLLTTQAELKKSREIMAAAYKEKPDAETLAKIRAASREEFEIRRQIAELDFKILQNVRAASDWLAATLREVAGHMDAIEGGSMRLVSAMERRKAASADDLAASGRAMHPVRWEVKTYQDAEDLFMDPRLKEEPFDRFRAVVLAALRTPFGKAVIHYWQNDTAEIPAGEFRVNATPPVQLSFEREIKP